MPDNERNGPFMGKNGGVGLAVPAAIGAAAGYLFGGNLKWAAGGAVAVGAASYVASPKPRRLATRRKTGAVIRDTSDRVADVVEPNSETDDIGSIL